MKLCPVCTSESPSICSLTNSSCDSRNAKDPEPTSATEFRLLIDACLDDDGGELRPPPVALYIDPGRAVGACGSASDGMDFVSSGLN